MDKVENINETWVNDTATTLPDTTPPASITNLTNTTGNFWINWTWTNPPDADFNHTMVYINGTWEENISTPQNYYNDTYARHATRTISTHTVDTSGNINYAWVNQTTTIPNNEPVLDSIGTQTVDEGIELNLTLTASDLDSDSLTFSDNKTFGEFSTINSTAAYWLWTPSSGDVDTYYVDFGVADGYGGMDNKTVKITVNDITPPASITNLANTTGNFWINWAWTNPLDADFNHTMVYINGSFEWNTSTPYYSGSFSAHATRTISTHTVDTSGNINETWINQTTTIPNNKPVLEAIGDKTINANEKLTIDANAIDLDSDTLTYSCNRTDLFADFNTTTGKGSWTPSQDDASVYYVDLGVTDGYGGIDNETVKITVITKAPPTEEGDHVTPSSSGGGGGGGGGPVSNVPVDSKGVVRYTVTLTSRDENAILKIPKGTTVLDAQENPLTTSISILRMPLEGTVAAYDLRPNGVKFEPSIEFTINYDPAKIPGGTTESDLVIKMLENGTWTLLETAVDITTHTASTKVSHFTVFALFAEVVPAPAPKPAPALSPTPLPVVTRTPSPSLTPAAAAVVPPVIPWFRIIIALTAAAIIVSVAFLARWREKKKKQKI